MALTTACTDSPSKLKVASPGASSEGGGVAARRWLMTWPVPGLSWGVSAAGGRLAASPSSAAASPPRWPARGSAPRWIVGAGMLAQPASTASRAAAARERNRRRGIIGLLYLLAALARFHLGPHLRPAGFDAAADGFDLGFLGAGRRVPADVGGGFGLGVGAGLAGVVARVGGRGRHDRAATVEHPQRQFAPALRPFEHGHARRQLDQAPARAGHHFARAHLAGVAAIPGLQQGQAGIAGDQDA